MRDPGVGTSAATQRGWQDPTRHTFARIVSEVSGDIQPRRTLSAAAVTTFFDFADKHPGEVAPEDVSRWRVEMERRGVKLTTVYARVSRVSAFYRWLLSDPQLSRFIRSNPAAQTRPRYPRPYQSETTKALTDKEMNSLLDVVKSLAEGGSVVGKRDYALLPFYFLAGLRRSEVIGLSGKGWSWCSRSDGTTNWPGW